METYSVAEKKKELRKQMKTQLADLPEVVKKAQDTALFKAFLGLDAVKQGKTVMVYWGVEPESATTDLISALLAYGKRVVLPRCMPGREMETRLYRGGRLIRNPYGIPEPGEDCPPVDVIVDFSTWKPGADLLTYALKYRIPAVIAIPSSPSDSCTSISSMLPIKFPLPFSIME